MKARIRPAAKQDILQQVSYFVEQDASRAAEKFIDAVEETVIKLTKQPRIGSPKKIRNI